MPSYKKIIIFCLFLTTIFIGCSIKDSNLENKEHTNNFRKVEIKNFDLENYYIMYALELEEQKMYINARDMYIKLFENTNNYEYFVKYLAITTQLGEYDLVKQQVSKYLLENIKEEEIILRLYSYSLFKLNEMDKATQNAKILAKKYENAMNYELLATIYLANKDFINAHDSFENALKFEDSSGIVVTLASLEFFQLNEKEEAIERLKNYIPKSEYDFNLSLQLLAFYEDLNQKDKIVEFLKEMFVYYKKSDNELLLNKTKALFWKYVDKNIAISFWEEQKEEDEFLLNFYRTTNQIDKAYDLLTKLYKNTNNVDFLAQQAIIEFETAKDKKSVLKDVVSKFDIVIKNSSYHIYQNYFAYILIDYDINISRGLDLVKKALEQEPSNIAYLDTLAWGEYKAKNCKEAYYWMKQIVDEVGLEDSEIKLHWEKIQECKK
ncbi:tetratricopeptide repeat protein [Aliarcobacter butzleri]|uniref:tetratricopeptide repeat protein n=1 Tax=Aliarcobacter butzleri TaxID=28197 RepID=UPI00344EF6C3